MKFVSISDTHGKHQDIDLPKGDVLIHAGDITSNGEEREVFDFLEWFEQLDFEYKIFIAGNHDFYFENNAVECIAKIVPKNIIYLQDSGTTIEQFKIWGSPITPWFFNWAFNRHTGEGINKHWLQIPRDTDILITHGPVYGTLDKK